jgi:hypothetical protein
MSDWLSLLHAVKGGQRTFEMTSASDLDAPVAVGWSGDLAAFRRVVSAQEAEILAAEHELDARATSMRRMYGDVVDRDTSIRDLQRELHEKVGMRDELIRELQAALRQQAP